jgi:hypothetical protein
MAKHCSDLYNYISFFIYRIQITHHEVELLSAESREKKQVDDESKKIKELMKQKQKLSESVNGSKKSRLSSGMNPTYLEESHRDDDRHYDSTSLTALKRGRKLGSSDRSGSGSEDGNEDGDDDSFIDNGEVEDGEYGDDVNWKNDASSSTKQQQKKSRIEKKQRTNDSEVMRLEC